MDGYEFELQLQKLNPRLYLGGKCTEDFNPELGSTGIYLRDLRNQDDEALAKQIKTANLKPKAGVSARQARYYSTADTYLGGCTLRYVPEGNVYLPDKSLWAKGWREILLTLAKHKIIDLQKARKIFRCPSLGVSTWDTLSDDAKFNTHKFSKQEQLDYLAKEIYGRSYIGTE